MIAAVVLVLGLAGTVMVSGLIAVAVRGSVNDASSKHQLAALRHAPVTLACLGVLGVIFAVTAASTVGHLLGLDDDSAGFFLTWMACFAIGMAPVTVAAAFYGRRYRRAADAG